MTGRELDIEVALHVMGWTRDPQTYKDMEGWRYVSPDGTATLAWDGHPPAGLLAYSTAVGAAFQVVDHLIAQGYVVALGITSDATTVSVLRDGEFLASVTERSTPRAMCLAALRAYGVEVPE